MPRSTEIANFFQTLQTSAQSNLALFISKHSLTAKKYIMNTAFAKSIPTTMKKGKVLLEIVYLILSPRSFGHSQKSIGVRLTKRQVLQAGRQNFSVRIDNLWVDKD